MNNENATKKYFIETNIQFVRLLGSERDKKIIEELLKDSILYTSLHVYNEFRSLVIIPLIEYYFYLEHYPSVSEATVEFINTYSFRDRKIKALFQVISQKLLPMTNITRAQSTLLLYIPELERRFFDVINYKIDHLKCHISDLKIDLTADGIRKFHNDFACERNFCIENLIKQRKTDLTLISSQSPLHIKCFKKKKREEFEKLTKIYNKAAIGKNLTIPETKRLGDTVIALECPLTCTLMTYDSIFDIILPPLSKNHMLVEHAPTVNPIELK